MPPSLRDLAEENALLRDALMMTIEIEFGDVDAWADSLIESVDDELVERVTALLKMQE